MLVLKHPEQLKVVINLLIDLAKGLYLAAVAAPLITRVDVFRSITFMFTALLLTFFALKLIPMKGNSNDSRSNSS